MKRARGGCGHDGSTVVLTTMLCKLGRGCWRLVGRWKNGDHAPLML